MSDSGLHIRALLSILLTGAAAAVCTQRELVGAVGGSVTFPVCHLLKHIDTVTWTINTTFLIGVNVTHNIVIRSQRQKQSIVQGDYALSLGRLELGDAGTYRVELHSNSLQQPIQQEYVLRVYERLPRPAVNRGQRHMEDGICLVNLTCSVLPGAEVTYSWEVVNGTYGGPVLPIAWRPGSSNENFICVATNPVSNSSSHPVSATELCEGPPGHAHSLLILWIFMFLCAVVACMVWFLWRQKTREPTGDKTGMKTFGHNKVSAEMDMFGSSMLSQNTIPKGNPVNTLYSTVQLPKKMDKGPSLLHPQKH